MIKKKPTAQTEVKKSDNNESDLRMKKDIQNF